MRPAPLVHVAEVDAREQSVPALAAEGDPGAVGRPRVPRLGPLAVDLQPPVAAGAQVEHVEVGARLEDGEAAVVGPAEQQEPPVRRDPGQQQAAPRLLGRQDRLRLAPAVRLDVVGDPPQVVAHLVPGLGDHAPPVVPEDGGAAEVEVAPVRRPGGVGLQAVVLLQAGRGLHAPGPQVPRDQGGVEVDHVPHLVAAAVEELPHLDHRLHRHQAAGVPGHVAPAGVDLVDLIPVGQQGPRVEAAAADADEHAAGIAVVEGVAVDAARPHGAAVENDGLLPTGEVALIDADVGPEVVVRVQLAVHEVAVDRRLGDAVGDAAVAGPFALPVHDEDIGEQLSAAVCLQQLPPRPRRDLHRPARGGDLDRLAAAAADAHEAALSRLLHGEVEWADVGRDHRAAVVGADARRPLHLAVVGGQVRAAAGGRGPAHRRGGGEAERQQETDPLDHSTLRFGRRSGSRRNRLRTPAPAAPAPAAGRSAASARPS